MPSVADDPIDWTRDETRDPVPKDASIVKSVESQWHQINVVIFDGVPITLLISGIEELLLERKRVIDSNSLSNKFDWKHDLELARHTHRFHLSNLDYMRRKRETYLEYWRDWTVNATNYYREIAINGQKMIYLMHGAVALGAIGILTKPDVPVRLTLTAKLAVVFAAIGIISAGLGQLAAVHLGAPVAARVRAKLMGDVKWKKAAAVGRYLRRAHRYSRWSDRAIYASIIWFGAYVLILLGLLVSA